MSKEANDSQHDKLRKRLEEELSMQKSSTDTADYDWFLRGQTLAKPDSKDTELTSSTNTPNSVPLTTSVTPTTPLKSPTMANSPNSKALPTISSPFNKNDNDDDFLVCLSKCRTADAKLTTPISRSSTNSSTNTTNGLRRTATNVETSDIGKSRTVKKAYFTPTVTKPALQAPPKKKGFFKKIFGSSKSEEPKPENNLQKALSHSTPLSRPASRTPTETPKASIKSTTPSISSIPVSSHTRSSSFGTSEKPSFSSVAPEISKLSLADQYKDIDPQLSLYINEIESSNFNIDSDIESEYNYIYCPGGLDSIKYKEDEIPSHPDKPKLPSALSSNPRFGGSLEKELFLKQKKEKEEKESSMFGSLLHKTKTNTTEATIFSGMLNESEDTPPFSFEPLKYNHPPPKTAKMPALKTLTSLKPMKKVAFATTTFVSDPPQQIPSRNPRKGNVEICPNGELIIHKIDPQEKINSATGIVVGGSGHLRLINQDSTDNVENMQIDVPNAANMTKTSSTLSMSSTTSMDQTINKEDRILAAKKAREQHTNDNIDVQKENLTIDKPMVRRRKHMDKPVVTLKMDELYTRCCHLREILPIPATLKQIPKGSTDPIPYLHLRNPRPSMIEILSFTDFIRIAPVICVSLDGVSLTKEMFRIILSSLLYKRYLEKLSLRNTQIDDEGWKMLSLFLSMNKALKKLDLTQCPTLDVNTQRIKKKSKSATDSRMTCNVNDRSDRNWALFTASLIIRGGIDDIILTGCKIPDLKLFSNLLNLALIKTNKIGLAYNDLTLQHMSIISCYLQSNPNIIGIDLAYNDLSSILKPLVDYSKIEKTKDDLLAMISLNSCNLIDCNDTDELFNALSKLPNLKYLDLSSNSKLFKTFSSKLMSYLPLFHKLARLNIDNNNLDAKSMVNFLECVSLIPNLSYLSIVGNSIDEVVANSVCRTLKHSKSLFSVDFDKSLVSAKIQEKIGLLTMRNIERQLYKSKGDYKNINEKITAIISNSEREMLKKKIGLNDDMTFTEVLYKILKSNDIDQETVDKFLDLVVCTRSRLKLIIQELMNLNLRNELSLQGKELLIRICAMDSSITKSFDLINNPKINAIKNLDSKFGNYNDSLNNIFAHDLGTELDSILSNFKSNPVEARKKLKDYMLQSTDPYALIRLLECLKSYNIKISDLFLRKFKCTNQNETIDDDASIDSSEFNEPYVEEHGEGEGDVNEDNEQMNQVYDSILSDFSKSKN